MHRSLFVDDEAVEVNTLHTDHDIDIFQGLGKAAKTQKARERFSTFLKDTPARPLQRPSFKRFKHSDALLINSSRHANLSAKVALLKLYRHLKHHNLKYFLLIRNHQLRGRL